MNFSLNDKSTMERDLDILMLRQQVEEGEQPVQQQSNQVWRYGEKPLKTLRITQSSKNMTQSVPNIAQSATNMTQSATNMTQSATNMTQSAIQNKKFTRDAINTRMGDRDLLVQVGGNPFLSNNSYVNDIANRDQYLLARDSNFN